ncbi:DUF1566 domain-containing protein [Actinoplanes sp. NBRC 101535]|uniref:Lcl domain-containing protein n=1 Tax=Actinoplanes sp. NBRC 101535 TaxID=3032196 RepID=UPI0024A59A8E|nr:DUF1566 domain-containing protein [Actinoplanes sp. NBRC 101535]GLY06415.1 hypothetical protein Acsp01_67940 [Actinoplanes sp. NBRC 101535]
MSRYDDLVTAAQRGDRRARDEFARVWLPLVYNVIGRALNGHPDVDDVVQETMLRVIRDLPSLRQPQSVRAWVLTITMHQIGVHRQRADADARVSVVPEVPGPAADFEELAILRLRLTGERRQVAEAARWLDDEDRGVLALWWQEAAGELNREETAAALNTGVAYAAVRIQRMRAQLDRCRALVSALDAEPRCPRLQAVLGGWDSRPSPLWRKRIDRHVRDCRVCPGRPGGEIAVERLLVGCAMVPVPATLSTAVLGKATAAAALAGTPASAAPAGGPASAAPAGGPVSGGRAGAVKTVAASVVAVAVVAAGIVAYAAGPESPAATTAAAPAVASAATPATPASAAVGGTPSPSTARATSAAAVPAASPAPSSGTARCGGAGLASRWASWPMPGPDRPASYRNLKDGTVRDQVTCLEWQREPAPGTYTFTAAGEYCADLALDGGGWHLPTRVELSSIIDSGRSGPAIDTTAFPGTPAQFFWTSTPWAVTKTPLRAWIVNFYEGLASNGAYQSADYRVRCVRSAGGSGKPSYRIAGGQVTDPKTGLVWQRATSEQMSAAAATGYCAALDLGGHRWRLPTLQEVSTTVDDSRVAPAITTTAFPGTVKAGWYWTATRAAPDTGLRWALNYDDGYTNYRKIVSGYARCVR